MKNWAKKTFKLKEKHILLALLLIALLGSQSIIYSGYSVGVDAWPHFVRTKFIYDWLRNGEFPFFSFFFYSGYPALRFYSPLLYLIAGSLAWLLGGQVFWAMKIVLFLTNILSGLLFYWWLKEIGKDSFQSFFGSMVYLLIPWRIHYAAGIGTYPLFLIAVFLPLAFIALERLLKNPSLKNSLFLGLMLSLLILSHLVYAVWSFFFLFLRFILYLFSQANRSKLKAFLFSLLALLLTFLNSAFFLLPFILNYKNYSFPQVYEKLPVPNPLVLFGFLSETGGYTGFYLGWSIILLIGLAIYLRIRNKEFFQDIVPIGLTVSLLLTFIPVFLPRGEPLLTAGLPPQRFLFFFVFFAGILAIEGFTFLKDRFSNFSMVGKGASYLLFLIIIFDCLPRNIFPAYQSREELLGLRDEIYEILKREPVVKLVDIDIPTEGIDIVRRICKFPAYGFLFGNCPTVYGPPYHQFAPKSMLYVYPWINQLAFDLGDSTTPVLSENSLKIIRLCGISHIISLPTLLTWGADSTVVCLKDGLIWDNRFILAGAKPPLAIGEYPYSPLFLASNVKKPLPTETVTQEKSFSIADDWQTLLEAIEIDHEKGFCNFIPIKENSQQQILDGEDPEIAITNLALTHSKVEAELLASKDCFLRVALSYYPELQLRLDDKNIPLEETKDHFITFFCPAGRHNIKISKCWNPFEKYAFYLSLFSIGLSLVLFIPRNYSKTQKQKIGDIPK
ncbi:MAG: 6-pyruvoyl-tetrahydropterin synthase-related protein [candidate division WOR-3 bacterium]